MHNALRIVLSSGILITSFQWAAADTWDGGAGTDKWGDAANWTLDAVPVGTTTAFLNTTTPTVVTYDSATNFVTSGMLQIGVGAGTNATLNIASGAGTLQVGGDGFGSAARVGAAGGSGTINVSGGKLQIGTGLAGDDASLNLAGHNSNGTNTGILNISGGEVQIGRRILMGANNSASNIQNAALTLSGTGLLNMVATGSNAEGDLGMLRLGNGTNTVNFDGGEFRGRGIRQDAATASTAIYYNGTQFTLNGNSGTGAAGFIGSGGAAINQIKNGGLKINTNGFDGVIARAIGNFSGSYGILTKDGMGKLTFSGGGSSYSETIVNAGQVDFTANDVFGGHSSSGHTLTINAGALVTNSTANSGFVTVQLLNLNGGELRATNTLSTGGSDSARFQAYGIKSFLDVNGSAPSLISDVGQTNGYINIGGTSDLGGGTGANLTINVNDVTGNSNADLIVSAKFQDQAAAGSFAKLKTGFDKTGTGTMAMSGINRYTGTTRILEGTLAITGSGSIASSSNIDITNGAYLDVTGTNTPWALATGQLLSGDGTIRGAATINGTLAAGNSIGTMTFTDSLTLAGITELELDAQLNAADLISIGAPLTFGGILNVTNLGGTLTEGQSYNLFDFTSGTGTFTAVNLPTLDGSLTWDQSQLYSNGMITVIPEPGTTCLIVSFSALGLFRRRRSH